MRKKHLILTLIAFLVLVMPGISQDTAPSKPEPKAQKATSFRDRISLGGYLGAQFGTVTHLEVSPMAIYEVTPALYAGLGLTYMYYRDNYYQPPYISNGYGGSILARYHVWKDLFIQAEYDPLYFTYWSDYDQFGVYTGRKKLNTWVHDVLIGAGYRQWLGENAFVTFAIFYNVNESYYSPYRNPIIRIGFGIGL